MGSKLFLIWGLTKPTSLKFRGNFKGEVAVSEASAHLSETIAMDIDMDMDIDSSVVFGREFMLDCLSIKSKPPVN